MTDLVNRYLSEVQNKDVFNYSELAKRMWSDLVNQAKKQFQVFFDLENDYPAKNPPRTIVIPQSEWDFTECKFKCQLCKAGGDWEYPVFYFRCQLISGYAFGISTYDQNGGCFCVIPGKEQGNFHLIRGKDWSWVAPDNNDYKEGIDPEPKERSCWEFLEEYLKALVQKEIEKVQSERVREESVCHS